jgi:hypothetical protein
MSIKHMTKVCSVAALVLLAFVALGPAKLVPRSGLGWQIDHFVGYFALTLMVCVAWPRALMVGGALVASAVLLEVLQAFTPDRLADFQAALYSAGGVMAAILPADLLIQAARRLNGRTLLMLQGLRPAAGHLRITHVRSRALVVSLRALGCAQRGSYGPRIGPPPCDCARGHRIAWRLSEPCRTRRSRRAPGYGVSNELIGAMPANANNGPPE